MADGTVRMVAKRDGDCLRYRQCGRRIRTGDVIYWRQGVGAIHESCAKPEERAKFAQEKRSAPPTAARSGGGTAAAGGDAKARIAALAGLYQPRPVVEDASLRDRFPTVFRSDIQVVDIEETIFRSRPARIQPAAAKPSPNGQSATKRPENRGPGSR